LESETRTLTADLSFPIDLVVHPPWVIPPHRRTSTLDRMNGVLLWGLVLPILLVVAGTAVLLRRRNARR